MISIVLALSRLQLVIKTEGCRSEKAEEFQVILIWQATVYSNNRPRSQS